MPLLLGIRADAHPQERPLHFDRVIGTGSMLIPGPIIQDRDGFLWIGSQGSGVIKYDGYGILRYLAGPDSILDDNVTALVEDRDGILWIGTLGGLSSYDKATDTFRSYRRDPARSDGISSNRVSTSSQAILEDRDGKIWIATANGLNAFDKRTGTFTRYLHVPGDPHSLNGNNVLALFEDREGLLWVYTDAGQNRFDTSKGMFTDHDEIPAGPEAVSAGTVHAVLEDRDGFLWIGTDTGLCRYDTSKDAFTRYASDPDRPEGLPSDLIQVLHEDENGVLWIGHGNDSKGLTLFNPRRETFTSFRHDPKNPFSISSDSVVGILADAQGILWLAHLDGSLDRYDEDSRKFEIYLSDPDDPNTISDSLINTSYEDRDGVIWFGTGNGLNRYDRETGRFTRYMSDTENPECIPGGFICGPLEDRRGNFWVLSSDHFISLFDREKGRVSAIHETVSFPVTVIEDRFVPDVLWIVSWGEGLARFDVNSHETVVFRNDPEDPESIGHNNMAHLYQDGEGILWLPTMGGGLNLFDPSTEKVIKRYLHDPGNPESIGSDTVAHIFEDSTGILWAGTYGGGLNRLDKEKGTFKRYTMKNGFPATRSRTSSKTTGASCGWDPRAAISVSIPARKPRESIPGMTDWRETSFRKPPCARRGTAASGSVRSRARTASIPMISRIIPMFRTWCSPPSSRVGRNSPWAGRPSGCARSCWTGGTTISSSNSRRWTIGIRGRTGTPTCSKAWIRTGTIPGPGVTGGIRGSRPVPIRCGLRAPTTTGSGTKRAARSRFGSRRPGGRRPGSSRSPSCCPPGC